MSQVVRRPKRVTPEEYLAFETSSELRHEYVDGVLYAMVGGTDRHNLIAGNLFLALGNHLPDRCQVFEQVMKLRVVNDRAERFFYPDIIVSCGENDRAELYREQPILLAEVLSPSTERADRTDKFSAYVTIDTLQEYVIIAQDVPQVEIFRRRNAWQLETSFATDTITLESVALTLPVSQIYRRITF
jgi:Uma2 family endonuclease